MKVKSEGERNERSWSNGRNKDREGNAREKHALGWGNVGKEGGRVGKSISPRHSGGTVKI